MGTCAAFALRSQQEAQHPSLQQDSRVDDAPDLDSKHVLGRQFGANRNL